MKRYLIIPVAILFILVISCGGSSKKSDDTIVLIKTNFGDIKLKLYDDTPKHKNNFVKLVSEGFYNDVLFHRVINHFMIQGGDPNSRNAKPGDLLGDGGPGYTVPAEILPNHFHKKGVLAAARLGGPRNPMKESSGSQFYIVQGEIFRPGQLDTLEIKINTSRKNDLLRNKFSEVNNQLLEFKKNNNREGFDALVAKTQAEADSIYAPLTFKLTPEQRAAYTTVGGYPSLDGEYTVFGEVVEGLDVVDKIAAVQTDDKNRPKEDVRMKIEVINSR